MCGACHRMNEIGGGSGPDLTNVHTRFSSHDLANTLLSPSEEISDQYTFTRFNLKNGQSMTGRLLSETESAFVIYQSPYDMTSTTEIMKSDVINSELSAISPMPAKLLDRLNEQEVIDLFAFLMSGGQEDHEYYQ